MSWETVERDFDGLVSRAVAGLGRPAAATADDDERVLASVDEYLARGLDLQRWWQAAYPQNAFAQRFALGRPFNQPAESFGFFDHADVAGRSTPIMGNFQEMFYDQPKSSQDGRAQAALWMRDQMRQFVLRYFMRVSDFREPAGYAGEAPVEKGFGFQQFFYKRLSDGAIGRFPEAERFAVVDLRELGRTYEWIVVKVSIFDFNFNLRPFGPGTPQMSIPLQEESWLVLTRDFLCEQERPEPGVLGRYGLGYAFIKNPRKGFLAFGPGEFDAAIELFDFTVDETGKTRVAMAFVVNRPERIANLTLDPFGWGLSAMERLSFGLASPWVNPLRQALALVPFSRLDVDPVYTFVDLANLATLGAAEQLGLSREELERDFLVKHFEQHYQAIAGSLATWRSVRDWLDEASLPPWAVHGRSF